MDPTQNGEPAAPQIKLEIVFTPSPSGQGGALTVNGIPQEEPLGYWLLKKLEIMMDQFYAQRNAPKIVGAPTMHPGMAEFWRRGMRK